MNEWLWYLSRATGLVSLVLLTVVLVLGVVSTTSERSRLTAVGNGVHRTLALGMTVFLIGHIVTAVVETYVNIDWISAFVPFTAGYEPIWVGLGTIAFDLLLAVVATSLLRHRLPDVVWRSVHGLTWALWIVAVAHGFMMGTSDQPVLRGISIGCGLVGLAAAGWWVSRTTRDTRSRDLVSAQEWR